MNIEHTYFEWSEEYSLGVKVIDDAHRQLFAIVSRIIRNFVDGNYVRNKMTCIEAVKFLKNYTVKHFEEEEAYQLSSNYPGYKIHKKIHDNMRDVVVPALEAEMIENDYSEESVEHFVGVCAGWLVAHVLIEDQTMTGRVQSKWRRHENDEDTAKLEEILRIVISGLFHTAPVLVSRKYSGHELKKIYCCNNEFEAENGVVYSVTTAAEETVIEKSAKKLLDPKVLELEEVMAPMVYEIFHSINSTVIKAFISGSLTEISGNVIKSKDFYDSFENVYPDYTLLWQTANGYLAFCIRKKPKFINGNETGEQ
ncbi:MAG: hemerythrin family protein [Oscillospiraceae bacterium]|nr:hemerythrin family protein [Oscillospiraceae bacterium]